jgi:acetyl-CoA carboxylase biotin carboxyl carrier protein
VAKAKRPRRKPRPAPAVKKDAAGTDNVLGAPDGGLGLLELRKLIRLVQRTGIGELEISAGGRTVRISQHGTGPVTAVAVPAATPALAPVAAAPAAASSTDHLATITSPMVGTFYRAPAPDADAYVESGDTVEIGQTVCIVEAMKLMNEIESEIRGRIVKILVENAQPVEFGQKLFLVEPV